MKLDNKHMLLLAVLALCLFIRLYDLSGESIWIDECYSIKFSSFNVSGIIDEIVHADTHPPLYYLLLHYWMDFMGRSEFSVRLLSLLFGFMTLIGTYLVGNELFDRDTGLLTTLIAGVSIFHITHSQNARMYSLLALLSVVSFYFFIKLLKKEGDVKYLAGYILSSTLLMYTQVSGIFIIIAQNIYIFTQLLFSRDEKEIRLKTWILLQIALVVLYAPWVPNLLRQIKFVQGNLSFENPVPGLVELAGTFYVYSGSGILMVLFLVLLPFSTFKVKKVEGKIKWREIFRSGSSLKWNISIMDLKKNYLLLLWLLIPIMIPFIVSQVSAPILIYRATIGSSIALYLMVSKGILSLDRKYVRIAVIGTILVFSGLNIWNYNRTTIKEPWRDVAAYIDSRAHQNDMVLFNTSADEILNYCFDYYSKRPDLVKQSFPRKEIAVNDDNIKELAPLIKNRNRIWLVLSRSADSQDLINQTLRENYKLDDYREYLQIEVFLYDHK